VEVALVLTHDGGEHLGGQVEVALVEEAEDGDGLLDEVDDLVEDGLVGRATGRRG